MQPGGECFHERIGRSCGPGHLSLGGDESGLHPEPGAKRPLVLGSIGDCGELAMMPPVLGRTSRASAVPTPGRRRHAEMDGHECRHIRLPERERVRLRVGLDEGDRQRSLADGVVLAHELV